MQPGPTAGRSSVISGVAALFLMGAIITFSHYFLAPLLGPLAADVRLFLVLIVAPLATLFIILAVAPRPLGASLSWSGQHIKWGPVVARAVLLLPAVLALAGFSVILLRALHVNTASQRQQILAAILSSHSAALRWLLLFLAVGVAPVTEELFFRGLVFSAFEPWGVLVARLISSVTFALAHQEPVGFLGFLVVGWYLTGVRIRTGNIRHCIAIHAVYNGILVALALLLPMLLAPPRAV